MVVEGLEGLLGEWSVSMGALGSGVSIAVCDGKKFDLGLQGMDDLWVSCKALGVMAGWGVLEWVCGVGVIFGKVHVVKKELEEAQFLLLWFGEGVVGQAEVGE